MSVPFEPIPDSTQAYVERLIGTQVGGFEVQVRVTEGRLGTIYRAQQLASGKPVTLEVLRAELVGDDEAAKAANAIKVSGIASVLGFGELPDGRRYRVMEWLAGESLDQRRRLSPLETLHVLNQVAVVLEASHAWAIVHGSLGPSSVFVHEGVVKVIDFGLARKKVTPQDDLKALGALGFTLLTGAELRDGPLPPVGPTIPAPLHELLLDLLGERHANATAVRKTIALVTEKLNAPPVPAQPKRSRLAIGAVAAIVLSVAGAAFVFWPAPVPEPVIEVPAVPEDVEAEVANLDEPPEPPPDEPVKPGDPPLPVRPVKTARPVPSAKALSELTSRLEGQLRKQARPGDDVEQALFVLNKQRLRLTGTPSLEDRKEVARQLAGWKRSYLRP